MDSIHVPGRVAKWILTAGKILVPAIGAVLLWLGRAGYGWLESRVSRQDVAAQIATVQAIANAVRAPAYHGSSMVDAHQRQLIVMWARLVELEAELKVYREYGKVELQRRNRLVSEARNYYAAEFARQLQMHGNELDKAAEAAIRANWRPTQ
jgi:hypothetical protein